MGRVEKEDLNLITIDVLCGGGSGAIERQEKRGQEDLVNSESLPTKLGYGETKELYAKIGIMLSDPYEDDPLFCSATLPEGWVKKCGNHLMGSVVCDDKERERVLLFYKAAFYDRKASMSLISRYTITYTNCVDFISDPDDGYVVLDHGTTPNTVIYREYHQDRSGSDIARWRVNEEKRKRCIEWLDKHYPDHNDPTAYWG